MSNDLVSKLRPWVTTFSEAIRYQCQHADKLCVGGKIIRIFDLAKLMGDEQEMSYLTLDDAVGQMSLMIPGPVYEALNQKHSFKEGMIVLAEGRLLDPKGMLKKPVSMKKIENIENLPIATLVCWKVTPYEESEKPNEE